MTTARRILAELQRFGVHLSILDNDILLSAEKEPPAGLRDALETHKAEVIALHSWGRNGHYPDPSWPIPPLARCPEGWRVQPDGVYREHWPRRGDTEPRLERATFQPVFITSKARDLETGQEYVTLAYPQGRAWAERTFPREQVLDARQLVKLTGVGVPVHSGTASKAATFLAEMEALNKDALPVERVTTTAGWKEVDGEPVFVWGREIISRSGNARLRLLPVGPGDVQKVDAMGRKGSFEEWAEAVNRLAPFPRVRWCVDASLAAPLGLVLGLPTFIIDLHGDTSTGKTTAIEIAASVWGQPFEPLGGLVQSWDSTKVHTERLAGLYTDMPIFLDESQVADRRVIERVLYMLAGGVGRGRGAPDGTRATTSWRTVAFSTGEAPLTEVSRFGGARMRVISLPGSPFASNRLGKLVRSVQGTIREHHGHAGPLFVRFVLERRDEWPEWRRQYQERVNEIAALFPPGPKNVSDRLATYLAGVETAGKLAIAALGLTGDPEAHMREIVQSLVGVAEEADYGQRAMDYLVDQILGNQHAFEGATVLDRSPAQGYLGIWRDDYVALYPSKLEELLQRGGYSYKSAVRSWVERGWLRRSGRTHTWPVSVHDRLIRMICIPHDVLGEPNAREENRQ